MKRSLWLGLLLMTLFTACRKAPVEEKRPSINIDSVLALPPDTLEWEELEIPSGADGLFDDFMFNFVRNSRFQEERIAFPLPVQNGREISKIEREEWTFDRLEVLEEVNTMIFDEEADMTCAQDTSVNEVKVEFIFFHCDSVKQYVFKRLEGRWKLTGLNWQSFKRHANGEFYAFYKQFATDSIFQRKRIRNPYVFKTYDEYSNEEVFGDVSADTWWDYSPELPKEMLTNINYGQCRRDSHERYLVITSPSTGISSTLKFRLIKWQWKLVQLEN